MGIFIMILKALLLLLSLTSRSFAVMIEAVQACPLSTDVVVANRGCTWQQG